MSSGRKTLVIGGGISGLAAAHFLGNATVVEAQPRLGGILQTVHAGGCIVEQGACSWLAAKPWAADLARELGLGGQLVGSNDASRGTFIWKGGEMVPFPAGMQLVVPTRLGPILKSRLVGTRTKAKILLDRFRKPAPFPARERTVGAFVADHFGMEAVDYIAEPLLSGIYGGDPFELSATSVLPKLVERERKQGSLIRGVKADKPAGPLFEGIRDGMAKFIDALTPREWVRGRAERVERTAAGYRVRLNGDWIEAETVVIACESHYAAVLMPELAPLSRIRHSSASAVSFGFRRADVAHALNGFGFLVPKREGRKMSACTWMNTKFPHRVAEGVALLRVFVPDSKLGDADAAELARAELGETMGISAEPLFSTVARWPKSLPLYEVGHAKRVAEIERIVATLPRIKLIGNSYHGVGVPDCVRLARQTAARAPQDES